MFIRPPRIRATRSHGSAPGDGSVGIWGVEKVVASETTMSRTVQVNGTFLKGPEIA